MDNDRELTLDMINMIKERNKLLEKLLKGFVAIIIFIVVSMSVSMAVIVTSYNCAMTESIRIYFETPFEYPTIEQSVKQDFEQTIRGDD